MRFKLDLTPQERLTLDRLAELDFRRPSEQLRWLVIQEARRRGLADADRHKANRTISSLAAADGAILKNP